MPDGGVAAYIRRWRPLSVAPEATAFARELVAGTGPGIRSGRRTSSRGLPPALTILLALALSEGTTITRTPSGRLAITGDGPGHRALASYYPEIRDWLARHPGECGRCGEPPGTGRLTCPKCARELTRPGDLVRGYAETLASAEPAG
jgi:hypothetical protein